MPKYLSFKKNMKEIGRIERPDGLWIDVANFLKICDLLCENTAYVQKIDFRFLFRVFAQLNPPLSHDEKNPKKIILDVSHVFIEQVVFFIMWKRRIQLTKNAKKKNGNRFFGRKPCFHRAGHYGDG